MKLTDIITKKSSISENELQFFIASEDFAFEGLPILKDALVFTDGKKVLNVNMIRYSVFQNTELMLDSLPKNGHRSYLVDKISSCQLEDTELSCGWCGIWHVDHFDKWDSKFSDFADQEKRLPILEYAGISFSSLMYEFDIKEKVLKYFINTQPVSLKIGSEQITLPGHLEISLDDGEYTIVPIDAMNYLGVEFRGFVRLNKEGVLSGFCSKDFEAEIVGYKGIRYLTVTKDTVLEIAMDGTIKSRFFDETTKRVEDFILRRVNLN